MKKLLSLALSSALLLTTAACSSTPAPSSSSSSAVSSSTASSASSDAGAPASSAASDSSSAASTTAEKITLNIAYMPNYASLCSVVAGIEAGFFEEEGIEIKLVEFADGPNIVAAMESGSIDIGYIGSGAHKLCIQGRAKVLAMSHLGNADAVMGLKSHGVTTGADLKGKTVAYASGTSSEQILKYTLEAEGLTMNDIKAMEMDASGIVTAMVSGTIDACATWSPSTFTITEKLGDDVVTIADNLTYSNQSASVASWIVLSRYAEEHPDYILRFTRALYKAMDYRADPANIEQVCQWVADAAALDYDTVYAQRGDADWITSADLVSQVKDGTIEKLYQVQQDDFIKSGDVTEPVPIADYVMFDNMLQAAE